MRPSLATFAAVLLLPAVLACTAQPPQREDHAGAAPAPAQASGPLCHVGPDGGPLADDPLPSRRLVSNPLVTDRGIGGTGGPAAVQIVDRGIGGTGIGGTGIGGTGIDRTGIGVTGILGVVTGFGSICVDGLEVQYDETATVDVDGRASSTAILRVGQVVALRADGVVSAARARTISVRSEVSGRMEDVESNPGARMIGGQPVLIPPGVWGASGFLPGDWVTVNGLRREDGVIVASRIDPAPAGSLVVRGEVRREGGVARIGDLVLRGPVADGLKPGQFVTASGHYIINQRGANQGGVNQGWVSTVVSHTASDPMALFGDSVDHIVWQAFLRADKDTVWLNGFKVATAPGVRGKIGADGVAIVTLDRDQDGSYIAVDLRYLDDPGLGTTVLLTGGRAIADASLPPLRSRPVTVPSAPTDAAAQAVNADRARFAPTRATVLDSGPPQAVSLPAPTSALLAAPALTAEPPMTPAPVPVAPPPNPIGLPTPDTAPSSSSSPASQFMSDKDSATAADPASVKAAALAQPASRARHVLTTASTRSPGVTTITTMTQSTAAVSTPSAGVAAAAPNAHAGGLAAPPARSGKSNAQPPRDASLPPAD